VVLSRQNEDGKEIFGLGFGYLAGSRQLPTIQDWSNDMCPIYQCVACGGQSRQGNQAFSYKTIDSAASCIKKLCGGRKYQIFDRKIVIKSIKDFYSKFTLLHVAQKM